MSARLRISWLDLKLGFRMLRKYPGLTIISSLAMAFAIAVGAAAFEFLNQVVHPSLPLQEGHRIVGIRLWHTEANGVEEQALYDYSTWHGNLKTITELGAFRSVDRNLIGADVPGDPIMTAEMSASGFTLARVPPFKGRTLIESDEQPGAPPVVVIGYDVWRDRFSSNPGVVGQMVQVGTDRRMVVGVMPEGFGFPRMHSLWIPLRVSDQQFGRRQGPWVNVFGRLATGVSMKDAQAELAVHGARAAADFPDTHRHIKPEVLPYVQTVTPTFDELSPNILLSINLFFVMLVVLVCSNVALLMFARAAARQGELLVRTALGASRGRIAGQLFAEALALGTVALIIGLAAAGSALREWLDVSRLEAHGRLPFWHNDELAPSTVMYASLLMLLGAAIAGIVPALKATGRNLDSRLRERSAGGGGLRFGGVWTAVIVTQVALTVAFPATAYFVRQGVTEAQTLEAGFATEQYISARLEMDPEFSRSPDGVIRAQFPEARYRATVDELRRRLLAEPGVVDVAFANRLPRGYHPARMIEIEGVTKAGAFPRAGAASVSVNYFDAIGVRVHVGRGFNTSDAVGNADTVIVNSSFVEKILGGRPALGLRMREIPPPSSDDGPGRWLEIVGVVPDLAVMADRADGAGFYRAASDGAVDPAHVVIHARGDLPSAIARLRTLAAAVDPGLRLHAVTPMNERDPTMWLEFAFLLKLLTVLSGVALLLSVAGTYAAMSFAVAHRTREIGIRVALGASAVEVTAAILGRQMTQIGLGVLAGAGLTAALAFAVTGRVSVTGAGLIAGYGAVMLAVCLLPSITPVRRALRVDPTEALRAEA